MAKQYQDKDHSQDHDQASERPPSRDVYSPEHHKNDDYSDRRDRGTVVFDTLEPPPRPNGGKGNGGQS